MIGPRVVVLLSLVLVASCAGRAEDRRLRDLSTNRAEPEEFSIVPNKPLVLPETYSQLPAPTPGAANRTDQTPLADAVAVLGGNAARLNRSGAIPAGDGALVQSASRFGVQDNIRMTLAEEDSDFRRRKSLFNWKLFRDDEYNRAYSAERLDAGAELLRFRRAGVRTPSAPPESN